MLPLINLCNHFSSSCFLFQPSRRFLHVVSEPSQIHPVHCVAQLQVAYSQNAHCDGTRLHVLPFLLLNTRLHREKIDGGMSFYYVHNIYLLKREQLINYLLSTGGICSTITKQKTTCLKLFYCFFLDNRYFQMSFQLIWRIMSKYKNIICHMSCG